MAVEDFIAARKEIYTKLLCDLIKAKTVNPPGDEYLAGKIIKKRISKIDAKYKIYDKIRHRSNVIARVGNEKGKQILITTHLDVVPPGDGWTTDPFTPVIKDGIVYGRGAADNKGPATASVLVLDYLKSIEKQLKNQFIFVYAADEETGSVLGLKYLLEEEIISPDYVIVLDVGGEMQKVTVAEKGILRLKVVCKGKQAHGANPNKGISAIVNMSKFIAKLEHHILKHQLHKFLSRPTINFGTITGGSAANIVAGSCECVFDIRYLPSQTPESIVQELKVLSERFGDFSFEMLMKLPPTEIDEKHILVQTILGVAEKHGINCKAKGLNGATDAKSFLVKGIPAVGFDFTEDYIAHNANESCNLDSLFRFAEVMIDICLKLDNTKP
jgi:acetylornithine deacetylase/succinyl-diaminopimelate desuccinylase family protein